MATPHQQSTETFHSIFGPTKLPSSSRRAREITFAMAQFIVKDLRPYVVVENEGFKNLIKVLEPKYSIPSRQHFSEKVIPDLYTKVSTQVKQDLKGSYVAITTDGWTSRATESYVTITSSHIDENWNLKNYVLQVKVSETKLKWQGSLISPVFFVVEKNKKYYLGQKGPINILYKI